MTARLRTDYVAEYMAELQLEHLSKTYADGTVALQGLNLSVRSGERFVLVGPSGCGKSTTLRLIAGLETPSGGEVRLAGRSLALVPPRQRGVAMVFQRPCLLPAQSVRSNLDWGNRLRRNLFARPTAAERAALEQTASWLGLESMLDRRAGELSGGEQQRVALGRALLQPAAVRLLDEPLGHLDVPLRRDLRRRLHLLHRDFPATMISVTHDPEEALALGDRIAVLDGGVLRQQGTPAELLDRPQHRFVAEFFATDPLNLVPGRIRRIEGGFAVATPLGICPLPATANGVWEKNRERAVFLGVRARDLLIQYKVSVESPDETLWWEMTVLLTETGERGTLVTCTRDEVRVTAYLETPSGRMVTVGERVQVGFGQERVRLFDRATGLVLGADG